MEEGSAGKLVLVDPETLTIALDDNIERSRSHIIDLRAAATGSPIPFHEGVARGHLVRAEPYLALKHPQEYFWSSVLQECLRKWQAKGGGAGPAAAAG